jgi:hypothetical protein
MKWRSAGGGLRVRVGIPSISELAPAAADTWTEVDRSANSDVELKGLSATVRYLVPVVPDPVHQALIAVKSLGTDLCPLVFA